jgi:LuxR family transcriptional regulator, maltose regulon positive regulatory protein
LRLENSGKGRDLNIAKISCPVASGVFPRKRLYRQLNESRGYPVIWISGPPGCGKTTLVSSYIETYRIPSLWYQIDEGDADISSLFYYLGLAARKVAPRERTPLPILTPEYHKGIATFALRYFEAFYTRLLSSSSGSGKDFVVVFDNYQRVPSMSVFHEVMSEGLSIIPQKMKVVIISRREQPPGLARLCATNKMRFITWDDLRFSLHEYRELIKVKKQKIPDSGLLERVYKKADGWAAGLILLMEMAKVRKIDYGLLDILTPEEVFDYFVSEIYEKADDKMQEFLMRTAFLPGMTSGMARVLSGNPRAGQILEELNRNHYFTEKISQVDPFYQYHPLFREFLISRAKAQVSGEEINGIRAAAAGLSEESGHLENAAELYLEAGSWDRMTDLVKKHAHELIGHGRYATLETWLDRIPEDVRRRRPWLLYWYGACLQPFDPDKSNTHFEEAFSKFRETGDTAGLFMTWSGLVESVIFSREGLKPLDGWFSVLDDLLKEFGEFPSEQIEARVICSMMRALSLRRPSMVDREYWADKAFAVAGKNADAGLKAGLLMNLACYYYSGVELQRLEAVLEMLDVMEKSQAIPPLIAIIRSWLEAAYCNITLRHDQGLKAVRRGLDLSASKGIHLMDYMLMGQGVLLSIKAVKSDLTRGYLQEMSYSLASAKPWEAGFYHYAASWNALYSDDIPVAAFHSERCLKLSEEVGNPWTISMASLLRALIIYDKGDREGAFLSLERASCLGEESRNEFTQFACMLTEAYFSFLNGCVKEAKELLSRGMQLGKNRGYVSLYMRKPGMLEYLMEKSLGSGIEERYAKELIQKNNLSPGLSFRSEAWPYPVKLYSLGNFQLLLNEKPVAIPGKIQKRPLQMLKALVALGGKDISEEQLTDVLWPEAEGDSGHAAFKTTLSRLRRLVGNDKAILLHGGKLTIDPQIFWVDAFAFEYYVAQAERIMKSDVAGTEAAKEEMDEIAEKAMRLYRGHFLSDEADQQWALARKERLKSKFVHFMLNTGLSLERKAQWERAVEVYERGLDVDDLTEEFYQRLIICYNNLGRSAQAMEIYSRCCKILSAVLGREPSPLTNNIHKAHASVRMKKVI